MPGVPIEHIDDVWDLAEPMLKKASDRIPGVYSMDDLRQKCLDGTYLLWFAKNAKCALIIKVSQYHLHKGCAIVLVGGTDMDSWIEEMSEIEEYARSQGCKEMIISGREGWKRIFKDYELESVTLKKEL